VRQWSKLIENITAAAAAAAADDDDEDHRDVVSSCHQ